MRRIAAIGYDRRSVSVGIVHFGVGNFHRSHQAMFVDRLLRSGSATEWGISGVGVLPADAAMRDALRSQDLEYTLVERGADGQSTATRIGSIVEYLYAPDELDPVLDRLTNPATRIVTLTITEGGYPISDVTGAFDATAPTIVADVGGGPHPSTVFGIIVEALRRRRGRGAEPFTVVSCDNVVGNGVVAQRSVVGLAAISDPALAEWIAAKAAFPNSMVDRITPATTDADRRWVAAEFGVSDAWPVLTEPFVQWVLEDTFPTGRPPLDLVGVQLVDDVEPYESMKLRLLNAGHQAMAYFGILKGLVRVDEAAQDPQIARLVGRYMDDEATPTLQPVPGVDLGAYKATLLERLGNPYVRDTLARLATDGSDRIPKFVVPVARGRRALGQDASVSAAIIAAWARYAELAIDGAQLPFSDRQRSRIEEAVSRQRSEPAGFLRNDDWFGELADDSLFCEDFSAAYRALLQSADIDAVLDHILGPPVIGRPTS